jgi:hypothetical protein
LYSSMSAAIAPDHMQTIPPQTSPFKHPCWQYRTLA